MMNSGKSRDPRQYLKNVTPAVMTVGGWFDAEDLYGSTYTHMKPSKIRIPPTVNNYPCYGSMVAQPVGIRKSRQTWKYLMGN